MYDQWQQAMKEDTQPRGISHAGRSLLPVIAGIWVVLIGGAFTALLGYHNIPGQRSDHGMVWPINHSIKLDTQRPNLMVFIHPQCPCSVATLNELARIQAVCGVRLNTQVIFYSPTEMQWEDTSKVRQALAIPNVHITNDADGQLAQQFGALTSGHTMLYSGDGRRIFSGGITPTRGHEGDNLGRKSIVQYVLDGETDCDRTNVFGCPILVTPSEVVINSRGSEHGVK
ncbi:hypothetical protein C5Y96_04680 [Blastopirellula marina]|uniref:RedB protein n=1 Tax=Blastopirellula marina TaxID=124 RepID=A0A2S8G3Y4_9BACT|nr:MULTISPECIES: hypothetical protein [Pirellulaceae]PQO39162.1 hypothetical protein C5Y96_04680 [Blastopirellula marina]RCS55470.1 hypothetical protein DTL36_04690 [Bremerella cremea]